MSKNLLTLVFLMFGVLGYAADFKVSGVVTSDEDGEPLIGAVVSIKEVPGKGVATDVDGTFMLTMQPGQTLKVSYMGFEPYEKKIKESENLSIVMKSEANMLDEVVAIGYGTMKKSDLTGSVSTVGADKLQKTPSPSLANALQGQAAGVTVNSLSGMPGAPAEVRIRGVGTMNNSNPIYVVDGVITEDIAYLSPSDIAHTEILKDASATAIYGSRGANGVIIVTTKTGERNRNASVTFDGYVGVQSRWRKLDVMGPQEYADVLVGVYGSASEKKYYDTKGFNEWLKVFKGLGSSPFFPTIYDPEKNPTGFDYSSQATDWQDEVFRDAMVQNYHLSVDGGGEKFTYSMSGSWFGQQGILRGTDYSRFTGRLNTSYQATPWLKIGENVSFMASVDRNKGSENDQNVGILLSALTMAPWDPTHYPEGSVNSKGEDLSGHVSAASQFKNVYNPFSTIEFSHPKSRNERWVGNVFAEITPLQGLTFRSSFSFDYNLFTNKLFKDAYTASSYDRNDKNFLSSSMARTYNWTVDNILTYSRTIGKHDFSVMAGQTVEEYNWYSIGNSGSTILNPVENNWYLSQVTDDFGLPSDGVSRSRRQSWLGRVNYSFDSRYLATFTFRADGSSKFPENTWGFFPSFALAWRLSQENFLNDVDFLSNLKLRFGWGRVGNDKIGNSAFTLNMFNDGPTFVDYVFGNPQAFANGAAVLTWINNGGKWESTEQWSLGVDFGFWNNHFTGSVDGFIRYTNDMLMNVTAPAHVGNRYSSMANVGQVCNKGVEISLDYHNNIGRDFTYSVSGNVSFIHNRLTALNGGSPVYTNYSNVQVVNEGHSLYYYNGLMYDGIFQTDEEALAYYHGYTAADIPFHAGDARYIDVDGDGRLDVDKDRVDLGSSMPWLNYGLNLGAQWKGIDLQLFFQGVGGNKIYNQLRMRLEGMDAMTIFNPSMTGAWTPDNAANASIPNPKNSINYFVSDRFLEDGSYFRLKNLQLGYTFPDSWVKKIKMQHIRLYAQVSNLFTITKYKGYDPEVSGVDYGNYPQCRTFLFGVNITY